MNQGAGGCGPDDPESGAGPAAALYFKSFKRFPKMTKLLSHSLLVALTLGAVAAAGCSSDSSDDGGSGGTGGSGATGGTGGTPMPGTGNTLLIPSMDGWVDLMDIGNDVGVQGSWYPYGDQYGDGPGDAKCLRVGMHTPEECSTIFTPPPPPAMGFANEGGKMCTTGQVAVIPACKPGVSTSGCSGTPSKDYSNVWGAGIGFDFNANKGGMDGDGKKNMWNPAMYGVIGVSFEIDTVPTAGLRVEFPIQLTDLEAGAVSPPLPPGSSTDDHPDGAPYWGATSSFPNSKVVAGAVNRIIFATDVKPPRTNYEYKPEKMLGIQFHVPAASAMRSDYAFCISNLTMLRE
jgi:hypothetical protein